MRVAALALILLIGSVTAGPHVFTTELDDAAAAAASGAAVVSSAGAASGGSAVVASAGNATAAATNSTSNSTTPAPIKEYGPWAVPVWFVPPVVRAMFLIGSGIFLLSVLFVVFMTQTSSRMQTFHWYAVVIVIAATICYLAAWLFDGSTALVLGEWPLKSPRLVFWVRYVELCVVAPLFILCIASISQGSHLALPPATSYCLLFVTLSLGAFTVDEIKYFLVLPIACILLLITAHHLRELCRRAFHILPGWRADLTLTLSVITCGSGVAYVALWIVGPEGLFVMYLAHITLLTLIVDIISHIGFVGFLLSDGARLEAAAVAEPLLQRPRNPEHDQPVTVQGIPAQRTSQLV